MQKFDQLQYILNDISPTTHLPYTSAAVLHRAFFTATQLASKIPKVISSSVFSHSTHSIYNRGGAPLQRSTTGGSEDTGDGDELVNLGLAQTGQAVKGGKRFVIPLYNTVRINDLNSTNSSGKNLNQSVFFGLASENMVEPDRLITNYEPLRLSFEFNNILELNDQSRAYTNSFWFNGSIFNVYLQKVKKSDARLGIYLHRQNPLEILPIPSVTTSNLKGITPKRLEIPFSDARKNITAFFSINAHSNLGTEITRFSTSDCYSTSQSWGFKSFSLKDYVGTNGRLRVSIVLGLL